MDKIISLAKRRGFVFQSSEIYGGFPAAYDFGPLGVLLKNNLHTLWWKTMVQERSDMEGLDSAILMRPEVWVASGHVASFTDPMVDCKKCRQRFAADKILEDKGVVADKLPVAELNRLIQEHGVKCPSCGGELTSARDFSLLMKTFVGPVQDESTQVYLRAETCQGIYVNYKNVLDSMRRKLPFGIAQIGKAFRNEITTKNWIFRTIEFEQAEMQYFVHPKEAEKIFDEWKAERMRWWTDRVGFGSSKLRFLKHEKLAHYAKAAFDIEYELPMGWKEIEGIHHRGDWDLSQHSKFSGQRLEYRDPETNETFTPYIIETSMGFSRGLLPILVDAYHEEEVKEGEKRVVLKLPKALAPKKVAVFPLLANKPELVAAATKIYDSLRPHLQTSWDDRGNIGKRYFSQDEIGTPYCVTVDFDSLEDKKVTVRDRDTMKQERVAIEELKEYLEEKLV